MVDFLLIITCVVFATVLLLRLVAEVIKGVREYFADLRFKESKPTIEQQGDRLLKRIEKQVGRKIVFDDEPEQVAERPFVTHYVGVVDTESATDEWEVERIKS
jgi:hypothetical protein